MSKISLALVGVVVVVAATLAPSFVVRAQGTPRFEYARVIPYEERNHVQVPSPDLGVTTAVQERVGYRACIARPTDWACREFKPTVTSADALRTALMQLGNEGWELVSAAQEEQNNVLNGALTYLFKRPMR